MGSKGSSIAGSTFQAANVQKIINVDRGVNFSFLMHSHIYERSAQRSPLFLPERVTPPGYPSRALMSPAYTSPRSRSRGFFLHAPNLKAGSESQCTFD